MGPMSVTTDPKITQEAGLWLYRLEEEPSPGLDVEFAAWLARSPEHVQEYLFMVATSRELNQLVSQCHVDLEAQLSGSSGNVVSIRSSGSPTPSAAVNVTGNLRRGRAKKLWATAAVVAALGLGLWMAWPTDRFQTGVGEQRTLKLADGSRVQLNTRSRIELDFSANERAVRLLEGEALFTVAHEPTRPFRVLTATAMIQALGTQFDVLHGKEGTTVSVIEGRVRVSSAGAATPEGVTVRAGEQAHVAGTDRVIQHAAADVARTIAWQQRRLDFRGATLAEIAGEFNRYNELQIRIEDPAIRERQLDGVFDADEPKALLDYLAQDKSLRLEQPSRDVVVVRTR
jgi:transmembrane sensor